MKNEIIQEANFYPEDVKAMYAYIEAIKTLNLKPEVELGLSRSIHNTYVFHVTALKPVEVDGIYVNSGSVTFPSNVDVDSIKSYINSYYSEKISSAR